jgi:hypothetical protein
MDLANEAEDFKVLEVRLVVLSRDIFHIRGRGHVPANAGISTRTIMTVLDRFQCEKTARDEGVEALDRTVKWNESLQQYGECSAVCKVATGIGWMKVNRDWLDGGNNNLPLRAVTRT